MNAKSIMPIFIVILVFMCVVNYGFAAYLYLSLKPSLIFYDSSGMQLIWHIFITLPVVITSTACFACLSYIKRLSPLFWKLNLAGLLIPFISIQSGITYYGFDHIGTALSSSLIVMLLMLFYLKRETL